MSKTVTLSGLVVLTLASFGVFLALDAKVNKRSETMEQFLTSGIVFLIAFGLLIFTGYYVYKNFLNKCTPSDTERTAAGGDGVLTFEKDSSGNCVAATCNTVAGYSLINGICSSPCLMVDGVSVPTNFKWVDVVNSTGVDGKKLETFKTAYNNGNLRYFKSGTKGETGVAKTDGYKFLAVTMVDGSSCEYYYLIGTTNESGDDNTDVKYCGYTGSIHNYTAGRKPDTTCASSAAVTGQPAGKTTWKLYDLSK